MGLQFAKMNRGRKRYLKTQAINDFTNWPTYLVELKRFVSIQSGLQIVGEKVHFEMSPDSDNPKMMLEVIGLPHLFEKDAFILVDHESCEILVHRIAGHDLFSLNFEQLLLTSKVLKLSLEASFSKPEDGLFAIFHIVFDLDKIELHFFRQKDYIEKQF